MLTDHVLWFVAVGVLTASMGALGTLLNRVWLSAPQVQLLAGVALGPVGLGLIELRWIEDAKLLEVLSEVAVIVSLYAAGMKMRLPVVDRRWVTPAVLASLTMAATVALVTGAGYAILGLPFAGALLLAATLAPTDPVLAEEVQVETPEDYDRLRLALTGEAGFNDGTAFPFVLLSVGLIGNAVGADLHPLGEGLWRWVAVDLLWKVAGGLVFGFVAGKFFGRALIVARKRYEADAGAEELLTLGLIGLTYGLALFLNTYAFLAVFAAAVALRGLEMGESGADADPGEEPSDAIPGDAEGGRRRGAGIGPGADPRGGRAGTAGGIIPGGGRGPAALAGPGERPGDLGVRGRRRLRHPAADGVRDDLVLRPERRAAGDGGVVRHPRGRHDLLPVARLHAGRRGRRPGPRRPAGGLRDRHHRRQRAAARVLGDPADGVVFRQARGRRGKLGGRLNRTGRAGRGRFASPHSAPAAAPACSARISSAVNARRNTATPPRSPPNPTSLPGVPWG